MHIFLSRLAKRLYVRISGLSWDVVCLVTAAHFIVSWIALDFIGGEEIAGSSIFWYFYVTTATTVGYGDYVPTTPGGRALGCCLMVFGALTISLPILNLVTRFALVYSKNVEGC